MNEIWKDIPGYEGLYKVSDQGNIKSLNYHGNQEIEWKLKPSCGGSGYLQVTLCKNGTRKTCSVSLLVWTAFNGPIQPGMQVNHINEVKTDNRLENLNLMTPKENSNWATGNRRKGKSLSEMVEQYTLDGTHICTWFSTRGVEKELGINQGNISSCCNLKRKTVGGYVWKYRDKDQAS